MSYVKTGCFDCRRSFCGRLSTCTACKSANIVHGIHIRWPRRDRPKQWKNLERILRAQSTDTKRQYGHSWKNHLPYGTKLDLRSNPSSRDTLRESASMRDDHYWGRRKFLIPGTGPNR